MNERVMQFRIGMFVILAGLVLTWMLIWFGETPALLRENYYIKARYDEAPGVSVGIPVRKSGVRVGEVAAVAFDDSPNHPDGVIVTLAIESKYKIKDGAIPKINKALIGDVSIDFMPGKGPGLIKSGRSIGDAPIIDGIVAADPSSALAAATVTFERAGETLASISGAANGISETTKKLKDVGVFIETWKNTGQRLSTLADDIDEVIRQNRENFTPMIAGIKGFSEKLNNVLDDQSQAELKATIDRLNTLTTKLNSDLVTLDPLVKDLGADTKHTPTTTLGTSLYRLNRIAYDVGVLTNPLTDGKGKINTNGSLQNMVTNRELYDNLTKASRSYSTVLDEVRPIINDLKVFARKISSDPSILMRGALQR